MHRQFVRVIIDNTNERVLDILEYRDKDNLIKYLRDKKEVGLLAEVEEVTCDMGEGYTNAALEVFGAGHRVTIDRFHVMKDLQEQLTKARREIQRGLSKEEAKELKGTRWLWVENWENPGRSHQNKPPTQPRIPRTVSVRSNHYGIEATMGHSLLCHRAVTGASKVRIGVF